MAKLAFVILLIVTGAAYADGGCPPGQVPQQGNGWRSCVPAGNSSSGQGSDTPGVNVAARWVALAVDAQKGAMGESSESLTRDQAEGTALSSCVGKGGSQCKVVISAKNGCISMATSSTVYGTGSGLSPEAAKGDAMEVCRKGGGPDCGVVYLKCAFAAPL